MLKKVVFRDRDGVINRDSSQYVKCWSEFEFLPGSKAAIRSLTINGYTIFIITNQSIINRKMVPLTTLEDIHTRMMAAVDAAGGKIEHIFFCPHTPEENCACRKPRPGLIHQAQESYDIDLSTATMVGDNAKDIGCARNSGCESAILVRTGAGLEAEKALQDNKQLPDHVATDLAAAARWIIDIHSKTDPVR
ncbi:MAG: D-glycero-beta-D-manno-heptose 1,7-bisphosphate 7-phosphatase [Desulfobacterales bacterium]